MRYLVFLLLVAVTASPVAAQDAAEVEKAVDALAQTYIDGWAKADAAMCASIYADDADVIDFMGQSFKGRAAIQESIAETLATFGSSTIKIQRTSIQPVSADIAVSDGSWEVVGSSAEGAPTKGLYTVVLMKTGEEWKVVSNRSKVPPPMPSN